MSRLTRLILALLAIPVLAGCAREELQGLERLYSFSTDFAKVSAQFCTSPSKELRQKIKYLFVIDKSNSNSFPEVAGTVPSDPQGNNRYRGIVNFVQSQQQSSGSAYYGLVNFSDSDRIYKSRFGTNSDHFTDDKQKFEDLIQHEWHAGKYEFDLQSGLDIWKDCSLTTVDPTCVPKDIGNTNYLAALNAINEVIDRDVRAAIQLGDIASVYSVIFVSDGYPRVPAVGGGMLNQEWSSVDPAVTTIKPTEIKIFDLKNKVLNGQDYGAFITDLVFNTGYYYPINGRDPAAQVLLEKMVVFDTGDPAYNPFGIAQTFGNGLEIDYSQFAVPQRNVRYELAEVFLQNASSVWWDDGRLLRDSDQDGLPDEIEDLKLGSSPTDPDSDGNGVSDGVEYRTQGKPCKDDLIDPATCEDSPGKRYNYSACFGLLPLGSDPLAAQLNFNDRDEDSINDCEEWVLKTNRDSFDSNRDLLPDSLAFGLRMPLVTGAFDPLADPDGDAVNNYQEIQKGLPPLYSNKLISFKARHTELQRVSTDVDGDCYQYTAEDISLLGEGNTIAIYLVENNSVVENKPILRTAKKRLAGDATSLEFVDGDFN